MRKQKSQPPKLVDCSAVTIDIPSTWRSQSSKKKQDSECQTDSKLYQFADIDIQTGISSDIYQELVIGKVVGLTLLERFADKFPNKSKQEVSLTRSFYSLF